MQPVTDETDSGDGDGSNVVMASKQIQTVPCSSSSRSISSTMQQQQTHADSSRQLTNKEMSALYGWY